LTDIKIFQIFDISGIPFFSDMTSQHEKSASSIRGCHFYNIRYMKIALKKVWGFITKRYMSNLISLLALSVSILALGYTLLPRHRLSYIIKTSLDKSYLTDETKVQEFLNSPNYMLFFNNGNQSESVIEVNFLFLRNDTSKTIKRNFYYGISPFILEAGKSTVNSPSEISIAGFENANRGSFSLKDLSDNKENGIFKIEVTYIGKSGQLKTHTYTQKLKDIFNDLSYTTHVVDIE
jgi:hypothetical protein